RRSSDLILQIVLLHVAGDGPEQHGAAPEVPHLDAGVFKQEEIVHHSPPFLRRQGDDQRREQQLAGDVTVAGRQLFIELPLVGGVLVDQAQPVSPLGDDVRAERLPHICQFGGGVRAGQDRLLRLDECCILCGGLGLRLRGRCRRGRALRHGRGVRQGGGFGFLRQGDVQLGLLPRRPARGPGRVRRRAVQRKALPRGRAPAGRLCRAGLGGGLRRAGVFVQHARLRLARNDGGKPCKVFFLYSIFFYDAVVF